MTVAARGDDADYRMLHGAAFLALFCVGLYASTFGPALPFIADDTGVSLDTGGLVLTTFFIGSITASAAVAVVLHVKSSRVLGAAGLAGASAGALLLGLAPVWPLAIAGGLVIGLGDGLIIAGLHILMARTSRDVPGAINNLNLWFAVGAVLGPLWAGGLLQSTENRGLVYAGIAAVALIAMMAMLAARDPEDTADVPAAEAPIEEALQESQPAASGAFTVPRSSRTYILGAVLFLYVGAEFGLGSWVATYARETAGSSVFVASVLTAGFWLALAIGRVLTLLYYQRPRDGLTLLMGTALGAAGSTAVLALSGGNLGIAATAAFGAGLCMGPMWPATVALVSEAGSASDTAVTVTMGNAGGIAIPWLQGKVIVGAGGAQGVGVTGVLCALMFTIVWGLRRRTPAAIQVRRV